MFDDTRPGTESGGIVRTRYDPDGPESLAVTVTEAVARAEGVSADRLDARLFDAVDPDALDRLFGPTDADTAEAEVRFSLVDNTVVVRNTGEVFVRAVD